MKKKSGMGNGVYVARTKVFSQRETRTVTATELERGGRRRANGK